MDKAERPAEAEGRPSGEYFALDASYLRVQQSVSVALHKAEDEESVLRLALIGITSSGGVRLSRAAAWLIDARRSILEFRVAVGHLDGGKTAGKGPPGPHRSLDDLLREATGELSKPSGGERSPLNAALRSFNLPYNPESNDILNSGSRPDAVASERSWQDAEVAGNSINGKLKTRLAAPGLEKFLAVPIRAEGNNVIGVIYADNPGSNERVRESTLAHVEHLAQQAALFIKRLRDIRVIHSGQELALRIARSIASPSSSALQGPDKRLDGALSALKEEYGIQRWILYAVHPGQDRVRVSGAVGFDKHLLHGLSFSQDGGSKDSIVVRVLETRKAHFTPCAQEDPSMNKYWGERLRIVGPLLALPIFSSHGLAGVLIANGPTVTQALEYEVQPFLQYLAVGIMMSHLEVVARERDALLQEVVPQLQRAFLEEEGAPTQPFYRLLRDIGHALRRLFAADRCSLFLGSPPNRMLHSPTAPGRTPFQDITPPQAENLKWVYEGKPVLDSQSLPSSPRKFLEPSPSAQLYSLVGAPIAVTEDQCLGAIVLGRARIQLSDGMGFTPHDHHLLCALATPLAWLFHLRKARSDIDCERTRLTAVLNAIGEEVSVIDRDYTILMTNKQKRDRFVHDLDSETHDVVGSKCYSIYEKRRGACEGCPAMAAMAQVRGGSNAPVRAHRVGRPRAADGGTRSYEALVTAAALLDGKDRVLGAVEVVRDASTEHEAAKQLLKICHHQVRDLVGAAHRAAERLPASSGLPIKDKLRRVTSFTSRLQELVCTEPKLALEAKPIRIAIRRAQAEVGVDVSYQGRLPPVMHDPHWIQVLFANLFSNSLNACRARRCLRIDVEYSSQDGEHTKYAQIRVTDNGAGVAADEAQHIFSPGFRGKHSGSLGIGLYLSRRIAAAHGGTLRLAHPGDANNGASFVLELPVS